MLYMSMTNMTYILIFLYIFIGYEGVNCTTPSCGADDRALCNNNGVCSTNETHWSCMCDQFYEGEYPVEH